MQNLTMMKQNLTFLLLLFGFSTVLFAQDDGGRYGVKDTVLVKEYLEEIEELILSAKNKQAMEKLDTLEVFLFEIVNENNWMISDFFFYKGVCFHDSFKYHLAEQCFEKAFAVKAKKIGEDHPELVKILISLGSCYKGQRKYKEAINVYHKGLSIVKSKYGKVHLWSAKIYNNLGIVFQKQKAYEKALESHREALKIKKQLSPPDYPSIATSYYSLGVVYYFQGNLDEALNFFHQSLIIREEYLPPHHPFLFRSYNAIGIMYKNKGDYTRALLYYQKALNLKKNLNSNLAGGKDLADAYGNLGNIYRRIGDYPRSIEYLHKNIAILSKTFGSDYEGLAINYVDLSLALRKLGDYETALNYAKKALDIQLKIFQEDDPELGISYASYANIYSKMGEIQKSIEYQKKAIGCFKNGSGKYKSGLGAALLNLGGEYIGEENAVEAIGYIEEALEVFYENLSGDKTSISSGLVKLGECYFHQGKYELADSFFTEALMVLGIEGKQNLSIENILDARDIQNVIAHSQFLRKGNEEGFLFLRKAKESYHFYDEMVEFQRENISQNAKTTLATETYPAYEKAILTNLLLKEETGDQGHLSDAFTYAEKTKSLNLLEGLQNANALHNSIPDSLSQKEYDLQVDIAYYDKKLFGAKAKIQSETDSVVLALQSKLFDLRRQRDTLIQTFETQYPDYYRLKYDTRVIDVASVQRDLLTPEQTLVEYFVGDSSIYVFVIGKEQYEVREIKKDFPLEEWVESLRTSLSENYRVSIKDYAEKGHLLYQKLVAPVAELLSDDLIIIPDGVLGYIPFEALLTEPVSDPLKFKTYPYLLKDKQISYCYSATLLQQMIEKKHRQAPSKELVAFAPYYDGDTTLFANLFSPYSEERTRSEGLKPLPHTGEEVYGVSKLMNGEMFANQEATEERFVDLAGYYRIVHLATHGKANDKVGDYSFLAFTEIKDSLENELLYVRDLYNLRLNADMVVLSACETGIGELQRGEGIISLARGFTYAGAKSIFTTLWSVNDEQTKDLMLLFYKHLKKGMAKDKALRQAKLDFMKQLSSENRNCAHPYFWSGMIGVGDMRGL